MRPHSPRRSSIVASLAAAVAVALVAATAAAAPPPKPFRADIDGVPDPIAAGSTSTVRVTILNDSATQVLGSANVAPPAGYSLPSQTIAVSPPATATVVGSTVELRNLDVAPLGSFAVDITTTAPCEGNASWAVSAKRSSDYSGPAAFQLDVADSDLVTELGGVCHLGFVTQPANAELGDDSATESEAITGTPYDPDGEPVSIEVLDGADQRITSSTAEVSLALQGGTSGAVLRLNGSTDVSATASAGIATFAGLTVDEVGFGYELLATSPGLVSATSGPFNVVLFGQVCGGSSCSSPTAVNGTNTASGRVAATNVTPGDELAVAFAGDDPCAGTGYEPVSPDVFTVLALSNGQPSENVTLEITLVVFKERVKLFNDRGAAHFEVCFATDVEGKTFVDKSGEEVGQGLLPVCKGSVALNCIVSRRKDRAGNVTVVFRVLDGRGRI
jgi:hypothetical protein